MPYDPIEYPPDVDDNLRTMIDNFNGLLQDYNATVESLTAAQDQATQKDGTILAQLDEIGTLGQQLADCQQKCADTVALSLYGFNLTHADGSMQFVLIQGNDQQAAQEAVQAAFPNSLCYENGGLFGNLGAFRGGSALFTGPVYNPGE